MCIYIYIIIYIYSIRVIRDWRRSSSCPSETKPSLDPHPMSSRCQQFLHFILTIHPQKVNHGKPWWLVNGFIRQLFQILVLVLSKHIRDDRSQSLSHILSAGLKRFDTTNHFLPKLTKWPFQPRPWILSAKTSTAAVLWFWAALPPEYCWTDRRLGVRVGISWSAAWPVCLGTFKT